MTSGGAGMVCHFLWDLEIYRKFICWKIFLEYSFFAESSSWLRYKIVWQGLDVQEPETSDHCARWHLRGLPRHPRRPRRGICLEWKRENLFY